MNLKNNLLLFLLFFKFMVCFTQSDSLKTEQFILTTDTQTAVFKIQQDWVGGGGSMPILKDYYHPFKLNGLDIYFDESYSGKVREKLPSCYKGIPDVTIRAKIYLKVKTVWMSSNPPRQQDIYEAQVLEWIDIWVTTKKCDD